MMGFYNIFNLTLSHYYKNIGYILGQFDEFALLVLRFIIFTCIDRRKLGLQSIC